MKPSSEFEVRQMPALPIRRGVGFGCEDGGEGESRTMTKFKTPFVGEASMLWRQWVVWLMLVWGAHDLR